MSTELLSWHEQFCQHCLVMKGQSRHTVAGYRDTIRSFVKLTSATTLQDVTLSKIEWWISLGTSQRQWQPKTCVGRIKYMVVFAKWLVTRGRIESNPLDGISMPRLPKKIPRRLSLGQAEELLRFVRNFPFRDRFEGARAYGIIATFMYTGIRRRELRNLELRDVDLENGVLMVREGKGAKDRLVAIPPPLTPVLRDYLRYRLVPRYDRIPYFFVGIKARGKLAISIFTKLFAKLRKASGIYFAPHMLRHTYATLMLEGGCDIFSLSKLMGHSDIKTTAVYLSATVGHLQKQVLKHPIVL